MRSRILSSYILKEAAQNFFGALFAFTAMLLALNILKFASLIINRGVALSQIGMVFLSLVPTFLEIAIPMSALLGVMLAFARLSGDSEIVVMRASGLSILSLTFPIALFGALVTAASLYISLVARPWGYASLSDTLLSIASTSGVAGLEEGVFSKLGLLTIYSAEIDHRSGAMRRVLLDDRRDKESRKIVFAKSGLIKSDPVTKRIVFFLKNGEVHENIQGKYSTTRFDTNQSILEPQDLLNDEATKKGRQYNTMALGELWETRTIYKDLYRDIEAGKKWPSGVELPFGQKLSPEQLNPKELRKRINRTRIEAGRRFSMPYAAFMLSIIGLTLGVQPPRTQRTWGVGLSAVYGIGVFVIYYGFLSVGIALSEGNKINPLAALWLPNLVITILAGWTLYQVGTERWISVTQGIADALRRFRKGAR